MFQEALPTILSHRPCLGTDRRRGPKGHAAMLNNLTNTLDFQGQALALRSERQRLIAGNIANADTPGYVARDMDFAQALREATGSQQGAAVPRTTQAGHIGIESGLTGARAESNL